MLGTGIGATTWAGCMPSLGWMLCIVEPLPTAMGCMGRCEELNVVCICTVFSGKESQEMRFIDRVTSCIATQSHKCLLSFKTGCVDDYLLMWTKVWERGKRVQEEACKGMVLNSYIHYCLNFLKCKLDIVTPEWKLSIWDLCWCKPYYVRGRRTFQKNTAIIFIYSYKNSVKTLPCLTLKSWWFHSKCNPLLGLPEFIQYLWLY